MKICLRLSLCALLLSCASSVSSSTLPADLVAIADANGCQEIEGFYDRPGMVEPHFVYGFASEVQKSDSVIFWCRSTGVSTRFKLIAHATGKAKVCSGVVHETGNFPRGLSLEAALDKELPGFKTTDGKTAPPGTEHQGLVVNSMYDGVGSSFVCFGGQWLMKRWD